MDFDDVDARRHGWRIAGAPTSWMVVLIVSLAVPSLASALDPIAQVLSGDPAPDMGPDVTFQFFAEPAINSGRLAFEAGVSGPGISSNNTGVWGGFPSSLRVVVMEGAQPPGTPSGTEFGGSWGSPFLTVPAINHVGQIAVWTFLTGSAVHGGNGHGIWAGFNEIQLSKEAREGDPASGLPLGTLFWSINFPRISGTGGVSFHATLSGIGVSSKNNSGIWLGRFLIVREGDPAPGLTDGSTVAVLPIYVDSNRFGELAFPGLVRGPNVQPENDDCIWTGGPGGLSLVVRESDYAVGLGDRVVVSVLHYSGINDAGEVAYKCNLTGPGIDESNAEALWVWRPDGTALLLRTGQTPFATNPGIVFAELPYAALTGSGEVVIDAKLSGPNIDFSNDDGIWIVGDDGLRFVAREGGPALNTEPGVRFRTLTRRGANALGQVVFSATLSGPDISSANDEGIWATDPEGHARLIMRENQSLEVGLDDIRTVDRWWIVSGGGGQDGRPTCLDDAGKLAVKLVFTNGSAGLFVFDTVPAPSVCDHPDSDLDQDVDLLDFAYFQIYQEPATPLECLAEFVDGMTGL